MTCELSDMDRNTAYISFMRITYTKIISCKIDGESFEDIMSFTADQQSDQLSETEHVSIFAKTFGDQLPQRSNNLFVGRNTPTAFAVKIRHSTPRTRFQSVGLTNLS